MNVSMVKANDELNKGSHRIRATTRWGGVMEWMHGTKTKPKKRKRKLNVCEYMWSVFVHVLLSQARNDIETDVHNIEKRAENRGTRANVVMQSVRSWFGSLTLFHVLSLVLMCLGGFFSVVHRVCWLTDCARSMCKYTNTHTSRDKPTKKNAFCYHDWLNIGEQKVHITAWGFRHMPFRIQPIHKWNETTPSAETNGIDE